MSYLTKLKSTRAFTLIELLVVIAIIGILSSVVLASLNGAREGARDARRQTDLNQIQLALEQLYQECGEYPTGSSATTTLAAASCDGTDDELGDFMSNVPQDPNGGDYGYNSSSSVSYCLIAWMEGDNAPDNDADCAESGYTSPDNGGVKFSIQN